MEVLEKAEGSNQMDSSKYLIFACLVSGVAALSGHYSDVEPHGATRFSRSVTPDPGEETPLLLSTPGIASVKSAPSLQVVAKTKKPEKSDGTLVALGKRKTTTKEPTTTEEATATETTTTEEATTTETTTTEEVTTTEATTTAEATTTMEKTHSSTTGDTTADSAVKTDSAPPSNPKKTPSPNKTWQKYMSKTTGHPLLAQKGDTSSHPTNAEVVVEHSKQEEYNSTDPNEGLNTTTTTVVPSVHVRIDVDVTLGDGGSSTTDAAPRHEHHRNKKRLVAGVILAVLISLSAACAVVFVLMPSRDEMTRRRQGDRVELMAARNRRRFYDTALYMGH